MSTADAPFTAAERAALRDLIAQAPNPPAAATDALKYVQAERRYVSDAALAELAPMLGISTAALDEVATFYNLVFRKPVGEQVMFLCDSVSCWMLGRDELAKQIERRCGIRAGETTEDGRLTLLPIVCLGACDRAPALMLGERLHGPVDAAKLDALLAGTM